MSGAQWWAAIVLDSIDTQHFHHCREFYWTVLVQKARRCLRTDSQENTWGTKEGRGQWIQIKEGDQQNQEENQDTETPAQRISKEEFIQQLSSQRKRQPQTPGTELMHVQTATCKACVLACPAAVTKQHRQGGLWTTEIYCSQFWRLQVQDQGASVVRWGPSFGSRTPLVSSLRGRGLGALWDLFYKSTDSIHEGSTLRTQVPPKGPTF